MERDLIYDIGMHKGEDSAYYLAIASRIALGYPLLPERSFHSASGMSRDATAPVTPLSSETGAVARRFRCLLQIYFRRTYSPRNRGPLCPIRQRLKTKGRKG
jgi:hypothetical protein